MPLSRQQKARLNEVRDQLEDAKQARDDAVVAAWRKGASLREVGQEVNLSVVGVSKLLERMGVRKRLHGPEHEQNRGHWWG